MRYETKGKRNIDLGFDIPEGKELKIVDSNGENPQFIVLGGRKIHLTSKPSEYIDVELVNKPIKMANNNILQSASAFDVGQEVNAIIEKQNAIKQAFAEILIFKNEIDRKLSEHELLIDGQVSELSKKQELDKQTTDGVLIELSNGLKVNSGDIQNIYSLISDLNQKAIDTDFGLKDLMAVLNKHEHPKATKESIGLGKADNTSDIDKPISKATQEALDEKASIEDINDLVEKITKLQKKQKDFQRGIDSLGGMGIGTVNLDGGKKGYVLVKKSDQNGDFEWSPTAGGGVTIHNELTGRSEENAHPISAITGLQDALSSETTNRENADNGLQSQIDAITASSDVKDIVGTYAQLQAYDTSTLGNNDIIKVLQDETHSDETTYYRWSTTTETFTLIGEEGPYYTKSEANSTFVPQTRTVNGKALSSDISLTYSDVGAQQAGNYVTTNTVQTITEAKTFTKAVHFTGTGDTNAVFLTENTRFDVEGTTRTILGMGNGQFYINHSNYALLLRGKNARPSYNSATSYLALLSDLDGYVPTTRTVNGKALSSNISLTASDVGALPDSTVIPTKTSDLTNDSGYITGITSGDVTTALGYTPYDASNPNGYTSNVGTVTSINNTSPDGNGNVSLTIPSTASDVGALPDSTKYGADLSLTSGTLQLLDQDGNALGNSVTVPDDSNLANKDLSNLSATGQAVISGKVSKTGDTMTGTLEVDDADVFIKKTTFDSTTTIAPAEFINLGTFGILDTNGAYTGYIQNSFRTDNVIRTQLNARRIIGGANKNASLNLDVDSSGNPSCEFPNTSCVDGKWVTLTNGDVAADVSVNGSGNLSFDIATLLPNDNSTYEVLLSVIGTTGSTSGNYMPVYVYSDAFSSKGRYICAFRAQTRSGSSVMGGGSIVIPVTSSRKVYLIRSTSYNGTVSIDMRAYRRVGTNS